MFFSASTSTSSSFSRRTTLKKNQRYSMGAVPDSNRHSRTSDAPMWVESTSICDTAYVAFEISVWHELNPVVKRVAQKSTAHPESIRTHRWCVFMTCCGRNSARILLVFHAERILATTLRGSVNERFTTYTYTGTRGNVENTPSANRRASAWLQWEKEKYVRK